MEGPEIQSAEAVIDNGRFGTRIVRFETGRLARQAGGAVVAYLDQDTTLLSTTTAGKTPKDQFDFFPLTVDVEERQYAVGKIPGSFFRREGRPSTEGILACRLIDRPLRPLFVKGLRNEVQVVITVMSLHPEDTYDVLAINAASLSTQISGLPFSGPVAGVRIAFIDGQWVAFPRYAERARATFDMVVAGRVVGDDVAIAMIEAEAPVGAWNLITTEGATAPSEEVVTQGLEAAKPFIRALCVAQADLAARAAKETQEFPLFPDYQPAVYDVVAETALGMVSEALTIADKQTRENRLDEIKVEAVLAGLLVRDGEGLGDRPEGGLGHDVVHVGLVVREQRELLGLLGGASCQVGLRDAQRPDERLGRLQTLRDDLLRRRGRALGGDQVPGADGRLGLDHRDRDVVTDDAAGDDHVEGGPRPLGVAREGDPLAVDERDPHTRDRAGERQAGDLGGEGGGVDRQDVVGVLGVQRHDGDDDLDLVAQTLDEQGTQRAVDQPAGQDPFGGRPTLAAEERTRDLADGVLPLLDVHREGEEVELVLGGLAGRGGRQQGRVLVEVGDDGAAGLAGQAAGLESDDTGAEAAIVDDGLGGLDLGSLHGDALLRRSTRPLGAVFDRGPRIEVQSAPAVREPLPETGHWVRACVWMEL